MSSIEIYWYDADQIEPELDLLSPDERVVYESITQHKRRQLYALGRVAVRTLLADRLKRAPEQIEIEVSSRGKPYVRDGSCAFSLSHKKNWLCVALSDHAVGVDLESLQARRYLESMASRLWGEEFTTELNELSQDEKLFCFYMAWIYREAWAKLMDLSVLSPRAPQIPVGELLKNSSISPEGFRFERRDAPKGYLVGVCSSDQRGFN